MHNSPSINSHFNNIIHMIGNLPQGHEKPLKHALYNAVALLLLFICCAVGYALFLVLEPFFKPLLWALLVGSLLYPIKYSIAKRMKKWFIKLEKSETPLIFGVLVVPINIVNDVSKIIGAAIRNYYKVVGSVILSTLLLVWMYKCFPWRCFSILWSIALYFNAIISTILRVCNTYTFVTVTVGYFIMIYLMWNPERESFFRKTSLLMWIFSSSYLAHLTGSFQALTFVLLQILALAGFLLEVYELRNTMKSNGCDITIVNAFKWTFTNEQNSSAFKESLVQVDKPIDADVEPIDSENSLQTGRSRSNMTDSSEPYPLKARLAFQTRTLSSLPLTSPETRSAIESHIVAALHRRAYSNDNKVSFKDIDTLSSPDSDTDSTLYFKCLLWACTAMILWKHPWIWPLILIIIAIFLIKTVGMFFGVWAFLGKHIADGGKYLKDWGSLRYSAMVPAHVQGIVKITSIMNTRIYDTAKDSIDSVSSILVILGLILFLICAPIFMGVQIYSEGITVIQLTSSLINRTVVHNPELRQLLPPGWDDTMDSLLDNAYLYGREGLSRTVKGILQDTDAEKSEKLEKQLLELWDRLYQTWMLEEGSKSSQTNAASIQKTWESFVDDISKTPGMFNTNALMDFAKQNIGTVLALLDSLWSLLKGNITLMLGSLSAITSVLLGGSTAVLNFILSLVVFFTTLFYLLNSSSTLYKPIEMISTFSPNNGSRFGLALTDAVNGVFKATLKMAVFYGLWTWLIHNLFGAKIVYLPSALAAILAAIPFLGTYLACIPAVLDLWLAQESPILALLLAVCQFAPASYVDTIIYKEIKNGGHPYFTGLAIAGGIFCLGAEGAIFGPLLLCCLLVALNLSSTLFKETPLEESNGSTSLQSRLGRLENDSIHTERHSKSKDDEVRVSISS